VRAVLQAAYLVRAAQSVAAVLLGLALAGDSTHGQPMSAVVAAVLVSASYALELITAPLAGAASDRFGRKPLLLAAPVLGLAATQLYGLGVGLGPLFAGRVLEGAAAGALTPAALGLLGDATAGPNGQRGKTMAYFEIATLLGIASGYAAGGVLWQGFQLSAFRLAGLLYVGAGVALWIWLHEEAPRHTHTSLGHTLGVIRRPAIWRFVPAWLAVTAVLGVWSTNVVLQLSGPHHGGQRLSGSASGGALSAVLGIYMLVLLAGTFGWSRLIGRFPRRTDAMLIALAGMLGACAFLLLLNRWPAADAIVALAIALLAAAVATESGFTPAALAYLADLTEPLAADRGSVMGLYSVFLGAGELIGGLAGGPFAEAWGFDGLIYLTLGLATLATVSVLAVRRRERGEGRPERAH